MGEQFKVHDPTGVDAIQLMGILAGGGLAGQAQHALSAMDRDSGAGLGAISALLMGALANHAVRDEMRGFIFSMWKTTEDEQALEADLDIQDRLEPKYENGEYDKSTPYYRKLKRFYKLTPREMTGIVSALAKHPEMKDFLAYLREEFATTTSAPATNSNGNTGLQPVK